MEKLRIFDFKIGKRYKRLGFFNTLGLGEYYLEKSLDKQEYGTLFKIGYSFKGSQEEILCSKYAEYVESTGENNEK